ncbi:DUF481 domain-containing protein [Hanstruepera marina]|uniref:DUF481 domain-containing protein n=1 Tax=Hanstruepera marina TaxID=2873265 RepID=UPI001CA6088D|nr:DUF481 domain-containing protein [Hanstruepera marina]
MTQKIRLLILCPVLILTSIYIFGQNQSTEIDSTQIEASMPFRKGRWLTGLSGSIGSGSTVNKATDIKSISNNYNITISSGKFLIDRLNIGLNASLERNNIEEEGVEEITSELFFLGPKATYYLSKNKIGSVFFSLSPGYTRYRDKLGNLINDEYIESESTGSGFGLLATFGFSYVILDRVTFDLGLNFNNYWLDVQQKKTNSEITDNVTFDLSNISFSFGFKILIDSNPL